VHRKFKSILLKRPDKLRFIGLGSNELAENPQIAVLSTTMPAFQGILLRVLRGRPRKIFQRAGLDVSWLTCVRTNNASCATASNESVGPSISSCGSRRMSQPQPATQLWGCLSGVRRYRAIRRCVLEESRGSPEESKVDLASILASVMAHESGICCSDRMPMPLAASCKHIGSAVNFDVSAWDPFCSCQSRASECAQE